MKIYVIFYVNIDLTNKTVSFIYILINTVSYANSD